MSSVRCFRVKTLIPSNEVLKIVVGDYFDHLVAIDGDIAVIGAYRENAGFVHVYVLPIPGS